MLQNRNIYKPIEPVRFLVRIVRMTKDWQVVDSFPLSHCNDEKAFEHTVFGVYMELAAGLEWVCDCGRLDDAKAVAAALYKQYNDK